MNNQKLVLRFIASPLILGILILTYSYNCIKHFLKYLRYGGEWVTYNNEDPKRMEDIYKLLKEHYAKT